MIQTYESWFRSDFFLFICKKIDSLQKDEVWILKMKPHLKNCVSCMRNNGEDICLQRLNGSDSERFSCGFLSEVSCGFFSLFSMLWYHELCFKIKKYPFLLCWNHFCSWVIQFINWEESQFKCQWLQMSTLA